RAHRQRGGGGVARRAQLPPLPGTGAGTRRRMTMTRTRTRTTGRPALLTVLPALLALVLAACGGGGGAGSSTGGGRFTAPSIPMQQSLGAGEGSVNLVAWAGYVENGSTDPKVDWVTPFTQATGYKVKVKGAGSPDGMVQLMKSGEYDGVSASGDASLRLIAAGDVAPVNTDLVPNYKDVFGGLKLKPWNSVNGVA